MRIAPICLALSLAANAAALGLILSRNAGSPPPAAETREQSIPASRARALTRSPDIASVFEAQDPDARVALIGEMVVSADPVRLQAMVRELSTRPASVRKSELLAAMYRRWGEVDPAGALLAVEAYKPTEQKVYRDQILRGWALKDASAAVEWISADPLVAAGALGLAAQDLRYRSVAQSLLAAGRVDELRDLSAELRSSPRNSRPATIVTGALASYYIAHDLKAAHAWFLTLPPNSPERLVILAAEGNAVANEAPEMAAKFAFGLPENATARERQVAASSVFNVLGHSMSPSDLENWIGGQARGPDLDLALATLIPIQATKDPNAASRMLKGITDEQKLQGVVVSAANRIALDGSPTLALTFASENFPPVANRQARLRSLVDSYLRYSDAGFMGEHISTLRSLTEPERQSLMESVAKASAQL